MELADVVDSKSTASDGVPVRVRPPAHGRPPRSRRLFCVFLGENGGKGLAAHNRRSRCFLREFRASADARVPFPQGKGTKGCRGPARFPCGAPAPGPPADKYLVSVEPRRGAPDGVPFGSARTAPLKTFRFQRWACAWGREGAAGGGRASHADFLWRSASEKASPERGGAREAGGGVPFPRAARSRRLCQPP